MGWHCLRLGARKNCQVKTKEERSEIFRNLNRPLCSTKTVKTVSYGGDGWVASILFHTTGT